MESCGGKAKGYMQSNMMKRIPAKSTGQTTGTSSFIYPFLVPVDRWPTDSGCQGNKWKDVVKKTLQLDSSRQ